MKKTVMKKYLKPLVSIGIVSTQLLLISAETITVTVNHHPTNGIKGV